MIDTAVPFAVLLTPNGVLLSRRRDENTKISLQISVVKQRRLYTIAKLPTQQQEIVKYYNGSTSKDVSTKMLYLHSNFEPTEMKSGPLWKESKQGNSDPIYFFYFYFEPNLATLLLIRLLHLS